MGPHYDSKGGAILLGSLGSSKHPLLLEGTLKIKIVIAMN